MARYIITPWRTQNDLLAVRSQLYSIPQNDEPTDPDTRRQAVDRIMAWKLRGNLPHAVESTALLIDAILHHHSSSTSSQATSNSPFSIRAVYSAAFCRFVTGFCDIGRAREGRLEPSSMLDIARQIDMPAEFVALRHEATHEELPSVGRLVEATREALGWLWRVYWARLDESVMEREDETSEVKLQLRNDLNGLFRGYRTARRELLRKKTSIDKIEAQSLINATCEQCVSHLGHRAKVGMCAEVLVADRLLFPSNRVLGAPMQGAFLLWDGLLQGLHDYFNMVRISTSEPSFLLALTEELLTGLQPPTNAIDTAAASKSSEPEAHYLWLNHLLDSHTEDIDLRTQIMKWCCLHPGYWTARLGEYALDANDHDFVETWHDLFLASRLSSSSQETAEKLAGTDVMDVDDAVDHMVHATMIGNGVRVGLDDGIGDGWVRAALAPTVPIGVAG